MWWRFSKSVDPLIPAIFVAVALIAVTLVPMLVGKRIAQVREDATRVTDPVRYATREIQFYFVLETAGTRGYLLTGDSSYALKHHEARMRRHAQTERLRALAALFPEAPEVERLAVQLRDQLRPADALLDSLYSGALTRDEYLLRLPAQQARLEGLTRLVREIGNSMSRSAALALKEAQRIQVLGTVITVLLVLMAGMAALLVARLSNEYRALAAREAETRAESERVFDSRARLMRGFTHDVKSPLSAAAAHLSLMEDGIEGTAAGLGNVKRSVNNALRLVDDLVKLARAESGDVTVQSCEVDLGDVVHHCANDFSGLAQAKGLWLKVQIAPDMPHVETDPHRVRQIVENLLSNAVKYTQSGGVTVEVNVTRRNSGTVSASIVVSDTGPGLSTQERDQLFQEFRRLKSSEGVDGSGLGLAISRRVARALGGDIVVRTEPGAGCSFELVVECQSIEAVAAT